MARRNKSRKFCCAWIRWLACDCCKIALSAGGLHAWLNDRQHSTAGKVDFLWCLARWRGRVRETVYEMLQCSDVVVSGESFVISERDLLLKAQNVALAFQELRLSRVLGPEECASCTSHPVRALVEEVVCAVSGAQIVIPPWFTCRGSSTPDSVLVN